MKKFFSVGLDQETQKSLGQAIAPEKIAGPEQLSAPSAAPKEFISFKGLAHPFQLALLILLTLAIFTLDLLLPLGVTSGSLFVIVVLIAIFWLSWKHVFLFAGISTALIVAGYFFAPFSQNNWEVFLNRGISLGIVWIAAAFGLQKRKMEQIRGWLSAIVESSTDAIIGLSLRGTITSWNKAAEELFGYSAHETVGQPFSLLGANEKKTDLIERLVLVKSGKQLDLIETMLVGKDGTTIAAALTVYPIIDTEKEIIGACMIAKDITEKLEEEERFRLTVEAAPTSMIMVDASGTIELVNSKVEEMFGYKREEIVGQKIETLVPERYQPKHPEFRNKYFRQPQALSLGGDRELFAKKKNGEEFPVEIGLNPLRIGKKIFVLASVIDITQRMLARGELEKFNLELARSNKELEEFAYAASHDLQEPLRKVRAFSERLEEKYASNLSGEGLDYLNRMKSAAERMGHLINDLLTLSRVSTRTLPFQLVDLNKVVAEVLEDFELTVQELGAKIIVDDLPQVEADAVQMHQLFQNLVSNALKFHKKNLPPAIHIYAKNARNDGYQILVQDNGIGFDEKYLARIFQVFQRLHTRDEYPGTGIGTAICRKIAQRHGGEITAKSKPGEGSTFIVTLPKQQKK